MPQVWYLKQLGDYERRLKKQAEEIEKLKKELEEKDKENKELKDELAKLAERKQAKKPKFPDYSLGRQEKLSSLKKIFRSPGRRPGSEKIKQATREEDIYPEGVTPDRCVLVSSRIVTHIRDGKKEVVLYRIHRQKWGVKRGKVPHVMPMGEYGVEVAVTLAFLVYTMGLSHAQAVQVLQFFCGLEIGESEADSLLNQISGLWKKEFENLCGLVLLALAVHIDETGWKIKAENCFAWIFKTLSHTVLLYGEKRNEEVLDRILPRGEFKGVGITDCYKIYEKYFPEAQKCWAHFLRKVIRLMLLYPEKKKYRIFFEKLFELFKKGKTVKQDKVLNPEQKKRKTEKMKRGIRILCVQAGEKMNKNTPPDEREFINLQKNLIRNIGDLFTFVLHEEVEPTNNRGEQGLRFTAKARNNYQTSKTKKGAERRSVIASVLSSLKQNLPSFSLKTVTEEIVRWRTEGKTLFAKQLELLRPQTASP